MNNGTTIPVYVPRLHKRTARDAMEDAEDYARRLTYSLIAMAACAGTNDEEGQRWYEHAATEVPVLLGEYAEACFTVRMASQLLDHPDDCDDDLEAEEQEDVRADDPGVQVL